MYKIAVLVSGNGTNLQALMDAMEKEYLKCTIDVVISDKKNAFALRRASDRDIRCETVSKKVYGEALSDRISSLIPEDVDLVVLAGFLSILKGNIIERFRNRIINVHPSLIPSFCGDGMYGLKVHQAAVDYGVKVSGCTVHFVDSGTDSGPIIMQKTVPVKDDDTAESLQSRILAFEHEIFVESIKLLSENRVRIDGRRVKILQEM